MGIDNESHLAPIVGWVAFSAFGQFVLDHLHCFLHHLHRVPIRFVLHYLANSLRIVFPDHHFEVARWAEAEVVEGGVAIGGINSMLTLQRRLFDVPFGD